MSEHAICALPGAISTGLNAPDAPRCTTFKITSLYACASTGRVGVSICARMSALGIRRSRGLAQTGPASHLADGWGDNVRLMAGHSVVKHIKYTHNT